MFATRMDQHENDTVQLVPRVVSVTYHFPSMIFVFVFVWISYYIMFVIAFIMFFTTVIHTYYFRFTIPDHDYRVVGCVPS